MRHVVGTMVVMLALAGCGDRKAERAKADAKAATFVPPSVISRVDYGAAMDRRFRALDRNGDDRLTPNEFPKKDSPRYQALDRNGDGAVSAIEFSDGMLARFDRMDLNHDGTVTSEERTASHNGR